MSSVVEECPPSEFAELPASEKLGSAKSTKTRKGGGDSTTKFDDQVEIPAAVEAATLRRSKEEDEIVKSAYFTGTDLTEMSEDRNQVPEHPSSVSEVTSFQRSPLGSWLQQRVLFLVLFTILVLTTSAVLFVYGPSDVYQGIVSILLKFNPVSEKQDHQLGQEDLETEKNHPSRTKTQTGRLKTKESCGRTPSSKKKSKSGSNHKTGAENTGGTPSKRDKHRSKNLGANHKTQMTTSTQEQQENDDNNKWHEVTTKSRSGKARPPSREEQDIFPCGNKTENLPPIETPNQTTNINQSPRSASAQLKSNQLPRLNIDQEGLRGPSEEPRERTEAPESPMERILVSTGLAECTAAGLGTTMNSSGAFSDDSGLDLTTPSFPASQMNGLTQIKAEICTERKTASPFHRQQGPAQMSPFAASMDLPFSPSNPAFVQNPVLPPESLSCSSSLSPAMHPALSKANQNSRDSIQSEAMTFQTRITCLLQNLRTKPFSQNTVSQCHGSMDSRRHQMEDLGFRNNTQQRLNNAGFGLSSGSRSMSLSGNLNNRIGSVGQVPYLTNEVYLHSQNTQIPSEFHFNRQMSCGLPPQSFTIGPRLNHRAESLPLSRSEYPRSPQKTRPAIKGFFQHPLTNDCSLFSSNPSIWSVDLSVDKEFVNSSISGNRFNSSLDPGNCNTEFQQNVDFKTYLPDQLLSDNNSTG